MATKRATIAKIRKYILNGKEVEVPKFIHRHIATNSWSVYISGVRKYFFDKSYGGTDQALNEAKVFLSSVLHQDPEVLFEYAQINVTVYSPKNGVSTVHGYYKDYPTGREVGMSLGMIKVDVEFWPYLSFKFQDMPSWLAAFDFTELRNAWLGMHRKSMQNLYQDDSFKKFLQEVTSSKQQLALEL